MTRRKVPDPSLHHALLDGVIARQRIKNDAELSRLLMLAPSGISKIRRRHSQVTSEVLLRLHEAFAIPIAELKRLLTQQQQLDARAARKAPAAAPQRSRSGADQAHFSPSSSE